MIRLIILLIFLAFLISCTDNSGELRTKAQALHEAELNLGACQSRLEMYTNTSSSSSVDSTPSEPEAPAEPECQEFEYEVLTQSGKKLDTCHSESVEETPCGIKATDCESGQKYSCLKDVSYKTITKKFCE